MDLQFARDAERLTTIKQKDSSSSAAAPILKDRHKQANESECSYNTEFAHSRNALPTDSEKISWFSPQNA